MTRITVNAETASDFSGTSDLAEVYDPSGRKLGHFVPIVVSTDPANDRCPYSEEELTKFESESGGRTLTEIWKQLER